MSLTLDANVVVAANRVGERHHVASRETIGWVVHHGTKLPCPALLLPECAAAVVRATGDATEAAEVIEDIRRLANLRLIALDEPLAMRAAEIAMAHRLRGADSVYVAVAEAFAATLITWDAEMLERAPAVVPTMSPADWLARQPATP